MNRTRRRVSLVATAAMLLGTVWSVAFANPLAAEPLLIDSAVFEWTVNDESNTGAFNGQCNFMSGGESDGLAGTYRASDGGATVMKLDAAGNFVPISDFSTRCKDRFGTTVTPFGTARLGQKVVFDNGSGTVNPSTGEVEIRWQGTFTLNYYGSLTPFWIRDPLLTVDASGNGRVVATVGGYASSIDDPDVREKIEDRPGIVIANLRGVDSDNFDGFQATPVFEGVEYNRPGEVQVRAFPGWGSWPAPFVDVMSDLGLGAFWYTSGGAADVRKPPDPIVVTYGTGSPVTPTSSTPSSSTPSSSTPTSSTPTPSTSPTTQPPTSSTSTTTPSGPTSSVPTVGGAHPLPITVDVPEGDDGGPGDGPGVPGDPSVPDNAFSWTIDAGASGVTLGQVPGDTGEYRFAGRLGSVTVSDTREGSPAWSLSGQVSDFSGGLPGSYLGWVPRVTAPGAGVYPGETVVSGLIAGNGLASPSLLAAAPAGHEPGSATVDADLELRVPDSTPGGRYVTTLTLTALG